MTHEEELLVILMEECAEVAQEASKQIRFGQSNLNKELGDLLCMVDLLDKYEMLDEDVVMNQINAKREKLKIWSNLKV
jgi:NTP pyrophosphatase (non-canonical NTP hydrolase)